MPKKTPDPVDKHVGARVRMRRMMLSMSQEKLGDGLHLTFQQVQRYEKGTNRIGSGRLQQIANILLVPTSFFFEDAPGSTTSATASPSIVTDLLATREGIHLVRAFLKIDSPSLKRRIVDLVEECAA